MSKAFKYGVDQKHSAIESQELILGFRFGVYFFMGGIVPNPLDTRFQKVSGLSAELSTKTVEEGGQNLYSHRLPEKISYGNLVLERGMVVGSPLSIEFDTAFSLFKFLPSNVLVTLYNEYNRSDPTKSTIAPVASWMFMDAYPVKWSVSDLDATEKSLMIDTLELAYSRMQIVRI